jgi:hypothetical protein
MLVVLIYSLLVKMVTSRAKVSLRKHSTHGVKLLDYIVIESRNRCLITNKVLV